MLFLLWLCSWHHPLLTCVYFPYNHLMLLAELTLLCKLSLVQDFRKEERGGAFTITFASIPEAISAKRHMHRYVLVSHPLQKELLTFIEKWRLIILRACFVSMFFMTCKSPIEEIFENNVAFLLLLEIIFRLLILKVPHLCSWCVLCMLVQVNSRGSSDHSRVRCKTDRSIKTDMSCRVVGVTHVSSTCKI